ncbi:MAG: hypothetical protein ACKO9B_00595 [Planctomycetota bacterium]
MTHKPHSFTLEQLEGRAMLSTLVVPQSAAVAPVPGIPGDGIAIDLHNRIGGGGGSGRAGEVRRQRPGGRDQGAVARSGERER